MMEIENNDGCTALCKNAYCGDGLIDETIIDPGDGELPRPKEECDDENDVLTDGCNRCRLAAAAMVLKDGTSSKESPDTKSATMEGQNDVSR